MTTRTMPGHEAGVLGRPQPVVGEADPHRRRARRLLVVDDEENLTDLVQAWFELSGWQVWTASDGIEALRVAATCAPDLVLVDLMLPGVDGVAVLEQLLAVDPLARVVLNTARDTPEDRERARVAGAAGYIVKPCPLATVEKLGDELVPDLEGRAKA